MRCMNEAEAEFSFRGFTLPAHVHKRLEDYIQRGMPVGGFLQAVIANDLRDAVARADDSNIQVLPALAAYLFQNAPMMAVGSREAYEQWVRAGGRIELIKQGKV